MKKTLTTEAESFFAKWNHMKSYSNESSSKEGEHQRQNVVFIFIIVVVIQTLHVTAIDELTSCNESICLQEYYFKMRLNVYYEIRR